MALSAKLTTRSLVTYPAARISIRCWDSSLANLAVNELDGIGLPSMKTRAWAGEMLSDSSTVSGLAAPEAAGSAWRTHLAGSTSGSGLRGADHRGGCDGAVSSRGPKSTAPASADTSKRAKPPATLGRAPRAGRRATAAGGPRVEGGGVSGVPLPSGRTVALGRSDMKATFIFTAQTIRPPGGALSRHRPSALDRRRDG
jgi:hypothetical protein